MKVLVTGANGFIGSWLKPELRSAHDVVGVDRDDGDLTRPAVFECLLDAHRPHTVVHLAAKYGRLKGEVDPALTVTQNAVATTRVARACGKRGIRLVYVSSSEAYGDQGDRTVTEQDTYRALPHNIYGLSKRWGEEAARLYAPDGLLILRLNMPYGPRQEGGWGACALINIMAQALRREPIIVHRGAERSWCWVGDTARAIHTVIDHADEGVFNIARDDEPLPILTVAQKACELAGAPFDLIQEVAPPSRQTVVKRLSAERLRALGWRPKVDLDEGMRRTLDWVRTL